MVDKLSKALEGLKNIQFSSVIEDTAVRKKEKMISCVLVADLVVSLKLTSQQNLPQFVSVVIESFIHLCDDKDSDVRMVADENLNRIIRALTESNMLKVLIELHKVIEKNGPARCLRAALWRFGQLSPYIRPNKGRRHVQNLVPCLVVIAKREEESVHETLASSFPNIFKVLGVFLQDNDVKGLLKVFLHNLSSSNAVIRRSSASCIITIIQYCRKPYVFNSFVLNTLLDCVIPICEENSNYLVLGVLCCLRMLLPHLTCDRNDEGMGGSFGLRRKQDESLLSVDRLIQTYELCLHYTESKDHNVVTAALETLNQILQKPPQQLETFLLSPAGFSRSYIHSARENKLWTRSSSEVSVNYASTLGDESLLFDESDLTSPFTSISTSELYDPKQSTSRVKSKFEFSDDDIKMVENPFKDKLLGEILEDQLTPDVDSDAESIAVPDMNKPSTYLMRVDTEDKQPASSECSRSNSHDDLSIQVESEAVENAVVIDVGSFTDAAIPLIYCARHLTASFLLDGTPGSKKPDNVVRVSVKSLVLSCMSNIVKLYPVILRMELGRNQGDGCCQEMSDMLLFFEHSDPQIRGGIITLVGSFINSTIVESKGFNLDWLSNDRSKLSFKQLLEIIFKGLKDKSSVCSRQALSGLKLCLNSILFSDHHQNITPLLSYLPAMSSNSYWLLRVKLVEVLGELPFVCINDVTKSNSFLNEAIDSVILPLLGDEDSRVRLAAAETLVKIIPNLYYGNSTVLNYSKTFTNQLKNYLKLKKENSAAHNHSIPCAPFSHLFTNDHFEVDANVEESLSRIVTKLTEALLIAVDKYSVFGYVEALRLLSRHYPTVIYLKGWNCFKPKKDKETEEDAITSSLLNAVLALIVTSPVILDLAAFNNATVLLGNLFAGHCICNLKNDYQVAVTSPTGGPVEYWNVFKSRQISQMAEQILTHLLKMLNMYCNLLEEVPLSKVASSTATATALLPLSLPSPIKKQEKKLDKEDKTEDKKSKNFNTFRNCPHYFKLYQLLKNAHTNYKISLETSVSDKFLDLLESTVNVLSILLEVGTVQDTGRCAEEILSYLRPVLSLRASPTIICVIQLLKSLFGINLACNWEEIKCNDQEVYTDNLFGNVYQLPSEYLLERVRNHASFTTLESENLSGMRRRTDRKITIKNTDKSSLATFVRLFEPVVIKSLKLYTITSDVELQSNVLRLLNQLIQLRVNYCLVDADETFVGFVLKQFELIEHGQIPNVEKLLPDIFKFLILLSYEKNRNSKSIMTVPKILQLCDGLMASDQSTQTHCIPALIPIVEDVFLSRSSVPSTEEKELETQREVLLAMLLRLVEFPEVMRMLTMILNESRTVEERDRWKRWSRQVMDSVIPLASQSRLRIETFDGQDSFSKLMSSLSPNVLRPIDPLLKVLFVEPHDYNCSISLKRWLSCVTAMLETILHVKEDVLLNRLEEISPNINLSTFSPSRKLYSPDPFNVGTSFQLYESAETFARFTLKVISVTGCKISESVTASFHLQQQLSVFFVCVFHILMSGTFHRIVNALQNLLNNEQDSIATICSLFVNMLNICPMLTCQFAYFLALLGYCNRNFWDKILGKSETLSSKFVRSSGVIVLSDYLCENLSDVETLSYLLTNNVTEIIFLSNETPIKELLTSINRRGDERDLLMRAISSRNYEQSNLPFVEKLLRILEISDNSHGGKLICLLVEKFLSTPYLPLSRLASSIACRRVEYLLTVTPAKVSEQIDKETFSGLIDFLGKQKWLHRHSTLVGLLNKLGTQIYDLPPLEINPGCCTNLQELKNVKFDEEWFFTQVKQRCFQDNYPGCETASLLSKLSYEKTIEIMSSDSFNLRILEDCLLFEKTRRIKESDTHSSGGLVVQEPLFKASESCLLKLLHAKKKIMQLVSENLNYENSEDLATLNIEALSQDQNFYSVIWKIAPAVTVLINTIHFESCEIGKEDSENFMEFGVLCLKVIEWLIKREKCQTKTRHKINEDLLENGITCAAACFRSSEIKHLLSQPSNRNKLKSCIKSCDSILSYLIPYCRLVVLKGNSECAQDAYAYPEIARLEFLFKFISNKSNDSLLPSYMGNCFRDLIISLCRIPELSTHILKVPESSDLQDIELLEDFILKFSLIGWTNRQQFEEIWVSLLYIVNTEGSSPLEETAFIVQATTAAVEGITALLKNTLLNSVNGKLIHHGRDFTCMSPVFEELPLVSNLYGNFSQSDCRAFHFLHDLEMTENSDRYHYGLLSVEYIWTAVKQINNHVELYEKHSKDLNAAGLDLTSCVHLLTELYGQWMSQASPDIRIITSSLKSSIVISDLFTDIAQYQWLLDFCLRIEHIVIPEDIVVLPLIILGCCKAVSIVLPDLETCEKIKRIMLRSHNLPCKIATIQGLLYLLQSPVVCSKINRFSQQDKINLHVEEATFVNNIVDMFLPIALDVVQQFKLKAWPMDEHCERCSWALVFYLLQYYPSSLGDNRDEILSFILTALRNKTSSESVTRLLVRGIERLLLTSVIDEKFYDQVSKISLEMISQSALAVYRNGLQLMMILSFLDKRTKDIRQMVTGYDDPEKIMKGMEVINVLFERLKKSYPDEAEAIGDVINYILKDFKASDVLTKVIQEFLSPHQPHLKILSGILFRVFERAERSLLEDWFVVSLPSFTQGLPIATSIWTLNCFFVSASSDPWLRSMFPVVQSRLRKAEAEDKKLLCLTASHFYNQLKDEKQKKIFITAFENAAKTHGVYNDLLTLLR